MDEEGVVIVANIYQGIKLYLLTEKQAQELECLSAKKFYFDPSSKGNYFVVIGFVKMENLITENLFKENTELKFGDLSSFINMNILEGKRRLRSEDN